MSFIIYHTLKVKMDCIVLPVFCFTQKHSRNFMSDFGSHSITPCDLLAKARMDVFISTYGKPSSQISLILSSSEKDIVKKNQEFLTSIIKCVEFYGRQGIKAISEVYFISASMLVIKHFKSNWKMFPKNA